MRKNIVAAGRYARALFEAALDEGVLEEVMNSLNRFAKAYRETPLLASALEKSEISNSKKILIMESVCEVFKCNLLVKNLLKLLIERMRISACSEIAKKYEEYVAAALNITKAEVFVADEKIQATVKKEMCEVLESIIKRPCMCSVSVVPEIMGGIVLKIGDNVFDASIAGRMNELKSALLMR